MRVIIRFSLDRDNGGRLRNKLFAILQQHGFRWNDQVTSTYEHANINAIDLAIAMAEFWEMIHQMNRPYTFRSFLDVC